MNPYSNLGTETLGYLGQAGIDPAAVSKQPAQGGYPTYPNAAGVGSQTAGVAPAQPEQQPLPNAQPKNEIPDATQRGMSPYSLLGDANYRDTEQQ